MRIAVVRGELLTKWEMQNYEPLAERADVIAIGSTLSRFSLDTLRLPVRRLVSIDAYVNRSRILRGSVGWAMGRYIGRQFLVGLDGALAGYDIVHTVETANGFVYQAARAKRHRKLKLVTTCYETIPFLREDEAPARQQKLYVQRHTDLFLAMSQKAAQALRIEGVDEKRIRMHFPGIDLQHFRPLPRESDKKIVPWRHDNRLRVLLVGNIVPGKGVREFILAAAEIAALPALKGRVEFALVGNGDTRLVQRMVTTLHLQDVVTHKAGIAYADMPRLYASADLFVLPSIPTPLWEEQFGMVLAESMACGKAVVSTHSGAIPEVVADTGVLVPPYDHQALAHAVASLLLNEKKRTEMGERGEARARELFDCRTFATDLYAMYEELLS